MATTVDRHILACLLDPVADCLTPDVAAKIAALRADVRTQKHLDELAEKNAAGKLSAREDRDYAAYVEALDMIAILQAKARSVLKAAGRSK